MRKAFLKKAKATLEEMSAQTLRAVQQEVAEGREQTKDDGMDTYDLASESRDREIHTILNDRDRAKLLAIDDALERVEDGSYGKCEECGGTILRPRLQALPYTRHCVKCARRVQQSS